MCVAPYIEFSHRTTTADNSQTNVRSAVCEYKVENHVVEVNAPQPVVLPMQMQVISTAKRTIRLARFAYINWGLELMAFGLLTYRLT